MPLERVVPAEGVTICGHFYPGGTVVGMSPYITNRYKPTWGVDADQWRPSRLLEGEPSHTRKLEASLLSVSHVWPTCRVRSMSDCTSSGPGREVVWASTSPFLKSILLGRIPRERAGHGQKT